MEDITAKFNGTGAAMKRAAGMDASGENETILKACVEYAKASLQKKIFYFFRINWINSSHKALQLRPLQYPSFVARAERSCLFHPQHR